MTPRVLRAKLRVSAVEMARRLRYTRVGLRLLEDAPLGDWKVSELRDYVAALGHRVIIRAEHDGCSEVLT
jgi:hypothetical protein